MADDWKTLRHVLIQELQMQDLEYLDVVMAVILSIRLDTDPVWMMIIGPPGCGKTEPLRAFAGDDIAHVDGATEAALISGQQGADQSMVGKMNNKCWIFRDFGQILSKEKKQRDVFFSILRDAYDGRVIKHFSWGSREIDCKFSMLAATTAVCEKVIQEDKTFGERFLSFRPYIHDRKALVKQAQKKNDNKSHWRKFLTDSTRHLLDSITMPLQLTYSVDRLPDYAEFLATTRSHVIRDRFQGYKVTDVPEVEVGTRIVGILTTLAKVLEFLDVDVESILQRVIRGSIDTTRRLILAELAGKDYIIPKTLLEHDPARGKIPIPIGRDALNREFENLSILGILNKGKMPTAKKGGRPTIVYKVHTQWKDLYDRLFAAP